MPVFLTLAHKHASQQWRRARTKVVTQTRALTRGGVDFRYLHLGLVALAGFWENRKQRKFADRGKSSERWGRESCRHAETRGGVSVGFSRRGFAGETRNHRAVKVEGEDQGWQ